MTFLPHFCGKLGRFSYYKSSSEVKSGQKTQKLLNFGPSSKFWQKTSKTDSFMYNWQNLPKSFFICNCNFWGFFKFNWVLPHEWVSRSARRKVWKLMDCSEVLTPRVSKSKCMDWFFLPGQFFFQTSIFYQNAENISSFFWSLAQFIWCSISKNIDVILENS